MKTLENYREDALTLLHSAAEYQIQLEVDDSFLVVYSPGRRNKNLALELATLEQLRSGDMALPTLITRVLRRRDGLI